mgnify:CR=1 FL=1
MPTPSDDATPDIAAIAARIRADTEVLARAAESVAAKDAALLEVERFFGDGFRDALTPQTAALKAKVRAALGMEP